MAQNIHIWSYHNLKAMYTYVIAMKFINSSHNYSNYELLKIKITIDEIISKKSIIYLFLFINEFCRIVERWDLTVKILINWYLNNLFG